MAKHGGIGFTGAMAVDLIRYDLLAQDALRGVVKKVLTDVAAKGLPGDHHFFIEFDTQAQGVKISDRMREKYPEAMTIVLQHQFWDLIVQDERFDVGLSFSGVPERLSVPFAAIKGFFDPSVQFGLQFELATEPKVLERDAAQDTEATPAGAKSSRPQPRGAASEPEVTKPARASVPSTRAKSAAVAAESSAEDSAGAEVVSLDKFRKK
jgi:hypothetical protein